MQKKDERSIHISYRPQNRVRLHNALLNLVEKAAKNSKIPREKFTIVDLGCGRGELIQILSQKGYKVIGLDNDPKCVELSSTNNKIHVKKGKIEESYNIFKNIHVDMFILSHILEHTQCPYNVIQQLKKHHAQWICVAVPNPVRPKIFLKYHLTSRNYANQGHLYSWDRSHFTNFIEKHCELNIYSWSVDDVYSLPYLRNILSYMGLNDTMEVNLLPKIFPYLSTSLITLCYK